MDAPIQSTGEVKCYTCGTVLPWSCEEGKPNVMYRVHCTTCGLNTPFYSNVHEAIADMENGRNLYVEDANGVPLPPKK